MRFLLHSVSKVEVKVQTGVWRPVLEADPTEWLLPAGRPWAESIYQYWKGFDFGQKKAPSPWITLLALRVIKRVNG